MELKNKVCLIVGASGVIGTAVANRFKTEGASLALASISKIAEMNQSPSCDEPIRLQVDITKWCDVSQCVQNVIARYGRIDVLVNCAGVLGPVGPTASIDPEAWIKAVETNLFGSFYLTRAVLPAMETRRSGKIIFLSGGGAAYGRPFFTSYGSGKAALVRFTESLAQELSGTNIRVNAIAPGAVKSRMWEQLREQVELAGEAARQDLDKMDDTGGAPVERAASLALFLASDRSRGLTGRLISAIHDSWETIEGRVCEIMETEAGTLRRVPLA